MTQDFSCDFNQIWWYYSRNIYIYQCPNAKAMLRARRLLNDLSPLLSTKPTGPASSRSAGDGDLPEILCAPPWELEVSNWYILYIYILCVCVCVYSYSYIYVCFCTIPLWLRDLVQNSKQGSRCISLLRYMVRYLSLQSFFFLSPRFQGRFLCNMAPQGRK